MKKTTQEISMKLYTQNKENKVSTKNQDALMKYVTLPTCPRSTLAWVLMAATVMALIGLKCPHTPNEKASK